MIKFPWLFFAIVGGFCVFSAGCEKQYKSDGVGLEQSPVMRMSQLKDEGGVISGLVSLRYYKSMSKEDLKILEGLYHTPREEVFRMPLTRVIIAEQIYSKSESKDRAYLDFIESMLNSLDSSVSGAAAYSLGYLQVKEKIPELLGLIERGGSEVAINAAYGLANSSDKSVLDALCFSSGVRAEIYPGDSLRIREYLSKVIGHECEFGNQSAR